jgi:Uma2 family endonuclease
MPRRDVGGEKKQTALYDAGSSKQTGVAAMPTATVTPADLLRMPDEGQGYEIVSGELEERNKTLLCSLVAGNVLAEISSAAGDCGLTVGSGLGVQCFADRNTVRRADVAYYRLLRLTHAQIHEPGHCTTVPDLVVEVVSPNDLAYEVNEKRIEWLEAGAQLVWVIDPVRQEVYAHRPDGTATLFRRTDTLTADPVLPDFRVLVADLFRLPTATSEAVRS